MQKHNSPITRPAHHCHVQTAAFTPIDTKTYFTVSSCGLLACCITVLWYGYTAGQTMLEPATSIFSVNTEDRDSKFLWNIIIHLHGYTKSQPGRQYLNTHWHKNVTIHL